jgi:16S rRNA (cytosine967-C5)-methyltransferase
VTKKKSDSAAASARRSAVLALAEMEDRGQYIGRSEELEDVQALDQREGRQALEYVAGITRWRRYLDFLIGHYYRRDPDLLEPYLRQIIRLGLYDLLFLRTQPHAAINEAVELAKELVRFGAAGLVNGILRSAQRQGTEQPLPGTGDQIEDLAIRMSHPSWMVRRWADRFGTEETRHLLDRNNDRPIHSVRINTARTSVEAFHALLEERGIEFEVSPLLEYFVRVPRLQSIIRNGFIEQGLCAIQDESAALVVRVLDPQPGEVLFDTCSAPGGKTLHAAQLMCGSGEIHAMDLYESRLSLVRRAAEQQGATLIRTRAGDLRDLARQSGLPRADRVLVDAPCSGLGVLSRRADLRWNKSEEDIEQLTALQDQLLTAASALVKPGGLLVYSTCTIEPEENENRVAAFLRSNQEYSLESAADAVPPEMLTDEGAFRSLPHRHGVDGAFAVRLRRNG